MVIWFCIYCINLIVWELEFLLCESKMMKKFKRNIVLFEFVIVYYKIILICFLNFKVLEKNNSILFVFNDMLISLLFVVFMIKVWNLGFSFI